MSKQKKYHYIYKTTCKITGKFYVGMHSTDNLEDGYVGSGKILGYSISKHGKENHLKEILEHCSSRDELKKREKEIVNEELLLDPLCINLKYGGEGGGKFWSEEHASKFISAGVTARVKLTQTDQIFKANLYAKMVQTKKLTNSIGRPGISSVALANSQSATAKAKRSETYKQRKHSQGENNSNFGKCWINDGVKAITIKKELLNEYLSKGYFKGRTIK